MDGNIEAPQKLDAKTETGAGQTADRGAITAAALKSIEREKRWRVAQGHAVLAAVAAFEPLSRGTGFWGWVGRLSRYGCVAFMVLVPPYLVWRLLL